MSAPPVISQVIFSLEYLITGGALKDGAAVLGSVMPIKVFTAVVTGPTLPTDEVSCHLETKMNAKCLPGAYLFQVTASRAQVRPQVRLTYQTGGTFDHLPHSSSVAARLILLSWLHSSHSSSPPP